MRIIFMTWSGEAERGGQGTGSREGSRWGEGGQRRDRVWDHFFLNPSSSTRIFNSEIPPPIDLRNS